MRTDIAVLQQRSDDALNAYEAFVAPYIASKASMTAEQRSIKDRLLANTQQATSVAAEARKREDRLRAANEYRTGISADMSVTDEPGMYAPESPNSYIVDRVFAERNGHPRQTAAKQRLDEHGRQITATLAGGGDEARTIERYIKLENRNQPLVETEAKLNELRRAGSEYRSGITTATGSGGAWVVPVWLLDRTIYYNLPARPFLDALNPIALPPSGMVINVPAQTGPAAVGVHANQNTAIPETDVTSNTIPLAVQPIFGGQTISVEQLERESWGGSFDQMIMRSLQQAYDQQCDTIALAAALVGAVPITYNGTFTMTIANGAGGFYEKLAGAIATVENAAGVLSQPDAVFVSSMRWAYMIAQADANSRPLIVPTVQGPNNAVANASIGGPQGLVGNMLGLNVYKDLSIPTITPNSGSVQDQALVMDTTKVLALEASPTFETFPATLANQGSVYMRLHGYLAVGSLQSGSVCSIQGSAMSIPQF